MEDSTTGAADGILKSGKDDFSFCERWQNPFGRGPGRVPPPPLKIWRRKMGRLTDMTN